MVETKYPFDQENGEIRLKQKNQIKTKIEAQITRIKEQYCKSLDDFDRLCKKNEEAVDELMTGHEPIETGCSESEKEIYAEVK